MRAVVPLIHKGEHIGTVEYGLNLGDGYVERVSGEFGSPVALYAPPEKAKQGATAESLGSTLPGGLNVDPQAVEAAMEGQNSEREVAVGDKTYDVLYEPIRNSESQAVAALVVAKDSSAVVATMQDAQRVGLLLGLAVLVVGIFASVFVARRIAASVTGPVSEIADVLGRVGYGDFVVRAWVIGDSTARRLAERRNTALDQVGMTLLDVRASLVRLREAVTELHGATTRAGSTAQDTMRQAESVQQDASAVADNIGAVSAATEEMSASIREIAISAGDAAGVGGQALEATQRAAAISDEVDARLAHFRLDA